MKPVGRAALYLRVSSAGQVGGNHVSLDVQEKATEGFVVGQGGTVVELFNDPAKSGQDPDRTEYQRLVDLCRSGAVDTVVVFMLDRIGRNEAEFHRLMQAFRAWDVTLVSVCEQYLTDNPFLQSMHMANAAQESVKISMRVKPAFQAKLEDGFHVGSTPRGYDTFVETKPGRDGRMKTGLNLTPNAEDGAHVTRIFDLYDSGEYGLGRLGEEAGRLFGFTNYVGMGKSNLSRMLKNPVYLGVKVWGRHKRAPDEYGHRHVRMQPKSKWFVGGEISHKPLVEREVWDRVQARLAANAKTGGRAPRERRLLVGLIWCPCGSRVQVNSNRGYPMYGCHRRREVGVKACTERTVRTTKVDPVVIGVVRASLLRLDEPEFRERVLARLAQRNEAELEDKHSQRRHLEARHTQITNDLKEATADLMRHVISREEYELVAPDWRTTLASIEATLADLPEEPVLPDHGVTLRGLQLEKLNEGQLTDQGWREFLPLVVERVTLVAGVPQVKFKPGVEEIVHESALIRI